MNKYSPMGQEPEGKLPHPMRFSQRPAVDVLHPGPAAGLLSAGLNLGISYRLWCGLPIDPVAVTRAPYDIQVLPLMVVCLLLALPAVRGATEAAFAWRVALEG